MKRLLLVLPAIFTLALLATAQPPEFFTKPWKMQKIILVHGAKTKALFDEDSSANTLDLQSARYAFFVNGTYAVQSDTSAGQGTWALNTAGDSTSIDSVSYKLVELSAVRFTTRGFTLQIADANGTMDTAYTYVTLYPAPVTLPVKLISFTGSYSNGGVALAWSTAQEIESKEFQVQYSNDGNGYETIGTVPSKGNGTGATTYGFTTGRYQTGKNYYRLQQVDVNGSTTFSPVVVISVAAAGRFTISLSPNPASNKITLYTTGLPGGKLQLTLTTLLGQQVWRATLAGNAASTILPLPSLPKGVYAACLTNGKGEKIFYTKLLIQ